jgi:hypothetical protein
MRTMWLSVILMLAFLAMSETVSAQQMAPGYGFAFDNSPASWDNLDYWRQKRTRDFWNRTSPFFGDPLYDPMRTSPFSPYRAPQYHPWGTSPFRGDPYYDPYAPRSGRLDFYRRGR